MISKIQFQNISNSYHVDAEYNSIYDFNYGTIEASSEIGILSQEARSVDFKLILDGFLETVDFEKELIVVYNTLGGIEFKGFVKSAGDDVVVNYDDNTISITALDIIGFCKDSGNVSNLIGGGGGDVYSKNTIPNKHILLISLCSGLKNKLTYFSQEQSEEIFYSKEWYVNQYAGSDIEKYYISVGNAGQMKLVVRVIDNNNTRIFGSNDTETPNAIDTEQNYSAIDDINIYYYFIIKEIINNYSYRVKTYKFDTRNSLFGYDIDIRIDSTPSKIGNIGILHYDMRFFNNVRSIENFWGETGHNYWFNVTDYQPDYLTAVFGYNIGPKYYSHIYTIAPGSTQDGNELICWLKNEADDAQFIFAINYSVQTDSEGYQYVVFDVTWMTKTWGAFTSDSKSGYIADGDKLTGYYLFKRSFAYRGWQSLIIDDPAFFLRAYQGEFSKSDSNRPGNYGIRDLISSVRTDLFRCFGSLDMLAGEFHNADILFYGDKNNRNYASNKRGSISVTLDGKQYDYVFKFSMKRDRGADNDYFPNVVSFDLSCLGEISLDTYAYKENLSLSDAFESVLALNFLGIFCENETNKIVISNKHYAGESTVYAAADMIDLSKKPLNNSYPDTDYYSIFDGGTEVDVLNSIVNYYYSTIYSIVDEELSFVYSNIFSGITPAIGNNFYYDGTQYSVVSVSRKSENIFDIRAIKNGIDTLQFSDDGTTMADAELSNDGVTMLEWNIRKV